MSFAEFLLQQSALLLAIVCLCAAFSVPDFPIVVVR